MGQYNFNAPADVPSWTQQAAGGLNTAIAAIRQKRKDAQDQSNLDREYNLRSKRETFDEGEAGKRDIENGWSPETSTNAGGVPQTSTGSPMPAGGRFDVPEAGDVGFDRQPGPDTDPGMTAAPSRMTLPSGGGNDLASAIGQVRSARAGAPGYSNDEEAASGMGGSYEPDSSTATDPMTQQHTTSGQGDSRVGPIPTASDVHFGGMVFNPNNTPAARGMIMSAEIERQRELRSRGYSSEDRTRKTGELVAAGVSTGRAGAISDGAMNFDDATDNPQHFPNEQRKSDIDLARGLELERERRKTQIAEHSMGRADQTDRDIDKYADDAQKDYQYSQTKLSALMKQDMSLADDATRNSHAADIAQAQGEVNDSKERYKHYQGIVDQRIDTRSGAKPRPSTEKKVPTKSQIDRAAKEPEYRQYLQENGYDMSSNATGGKFMSPFRMQ